MRNGGTSAQNRLRMSVPAVRPNRLSPSSARLPVPSDSGTPSSTPTKPSATPNHCHDAKRSRSSTVPSAAVRIGWKACTSAVGVASTATSAACVIDRPKPCSSAPPSRRNGQDFRPRPGAARHGDQQCGGDRRDRKPRADQREGRGVDQADLGGDIGRRPQQREDEGQETQRGLTARRTGRGCEGDGASIHAPPSRHPSYPQRAPFVCGRGS